jgi:hypothetical protein
MARRRSDADVFDVEMYEAILDLCGIPFRRSFHDGGWTRFVNVDGAASATFTQWGKRFDGMIGQVVAQSEVA